MEAPAIPEGITDQGLLLVAFMLLVGLAVVTLVFVKGPALISAWRASAAASSQAPASLLDQLDRIEADLKTLKKALVIENEEGHPTAVSRKLASDIATRLNRIENLVKGAVRKRE